MRVGGGVNALDRDLMVINVKDKIIIIGLNDTFTAPKHKGAASTHTFLQFKVLLYACPTGQLSSLIKFAVSALRQLSTCSLSEDI